MNETTIDAVGLADSSSSPVARVNVPFEFRATGSEYFRIWIVNLLLTIVTLGIYSAWAKVRRLRYFYGSTLLDGHSFEYHATPLAILKGRLLVFAAYVVFLVVTQMYPLSALLFLVFFIFAVPWIIMRARLFQMRMTSYRNLRFNFHGTYGGAMSAFVGWYFIVILTIGIVFPMWVRRQVAYILGRAQKAATLERILDMEDPVATLVFCRTRLEVESLVETCNAHGHRAEGLHGGMMQKQRDRVMGLFRAQKANLLIATDVAARGLDIEHLSHVVNYDVPASPEVYLHRIGRTGRAGRGGTAITLAEPREQRHLRSIEGFTKAKLEIGKVPTVADLRARRLELTRASLRERLVAADFDDVRVVVESLADEFDPVDIAAAAVKMAHDALGGSEEREIPAFAPVGASASARTATADKTAGKPGFAHAGASASAGTATADKTAGRPARAFARPEQTNDGDERPAGRLVKHTDRNFEKRDRNFQKRDRGRDSDGDGERVRLFVGAGRAAGVRPADLVGAITGEAGVPSRALGAIEIADKFSLVEVPDALADRIIAALKATKIRGNKVHVRREKTT
jgi:hypothetical protein